MAITPKLPLYKGEGEPVIIIQPFVPMKTFKKLTGFQKRIKEIDREDMDGLFDVLSEFIVDLFQNKVTVEELDDYADLDDLLSIFFKLGEISKGLSPKPNPPKKTK